MKRRKKMADGTRGEEEDYNSGDDEEGKKRRQARRRERDIKKKENLAKGGRNVDSAGSEFSYRSVVSLIGLCLNYSRLHDTSSLGKNHFQMAFPYEVFLGTLHCHTQQSIFEQDKD